MTASIERIVPLSDVDCLCFDRMAIDLWSVRAKPGAGGDYVSPDPRFVILLDGASITLGAPGEEAGARCSVCFVPAGLPLRGRVGDERRLRHLDIHVDESYLRAVVGASAELRSALFLPSSSELRQLCALLADECGRAERPYGYSEALAHGVMHEVFHLGARSAGVQRRVGGADPEWLVDVKRHARAHLDGPLSIETLAAIAGMSRTRFHRQFRERVGCPPYQWIMNRRIERAQELLSAGAPASQIAGEIGFADQAHFSRCFREATGLPPGQWARRNIRSNR